MYVIATQSKNDTFSWQRSFCNYSPSQTRVLGSLKVFWLSGQSIHKLIATGMFQIRCFDSSTYQKRNVSNTLRKSFRGCKKHLESKVIFMLFSALKQFHTFLEEDMPMKWYFVVHFPNILTRLLYSYHLICTQFFTPLSRLYNEEFSAQIFYGRPLPQHQSNI